MILLTGGYGFLGRHVYKELLKRFDADEIIRFRSYTCDLREKEDVRKLFETYPFDIVIHLAASCGGIITNQHNSARFAYDTLSMGVNLIGAAWDYGVEKFIQIGTVCSYPKFTPVPFKESDLWNGYPEETNAAYGLAKKELLSLLQAYHQDYKFDYDYLILANMYGPGDNFDLETSHVIPAIIRKIDDCQSGKTDKVILAGTGRATRDFLYVKTAAECIAKTAVIKESLNRPVNIGTGRETSIADLAVTIATLMGYKEDIHFGISGPDGQPRRCLSITTDNPYWANITAATTLYDGLKSTIQWYKENKGLYGSVN